jgi:hypothetical protein
MVPFTIHRIFTASLPPVDRSEHVRVTEEHGFTNDDNGCAVNFNASAAVYNRKQKREMRVNRMRLSEKSRGVRPSTRLIRA